MNKVELAKSYQKEFGGTMFNAEQTVEFLLHTVKEAIRKGDKVSLGGFGIFTTRKTNARAARNPQTGEKIQIKASKKIKSTPALSFKQSVK